MWKPIDDFPISRRSIDAPTTAYRKRDCKIGAITRTRQRKEENPYRHSFLQRRRNHGSRLNLSVADLISMGWDADRRSIEMQAAFLYGFCPLCIEIKDGKPVVHFFRDMEHGLSDLTIDIINPALPPIWPGNVQWADDVCNSRKLDTDPILHGQRLQAEHELRLSEKLWLPPEPEPTFIRGPISPAQRAALELAETDTPRLFA